MERTDHAPDLGFRRGRELFALPMRLAPNKQEIGAR